MDLEKKRSKKFKNEIEAKEKARKFQLFQS